MISSNQLAVRVLALPRAAKRVIALVLDLSLCVFSTWLAFYLRLGEYVPVTGSVGWSAAASVTLALPIFIVSGLYRAIFRYSGLSAMVAVSRAFLLYGVAFGLIFAAMGIQGTPRAVGILQPILLFVFVGASRALARIWLGGLYQQQLRKALRPGVLIYGAGKAGRKLAASMANNAHVRVAGFLDDDDRLPGYLLDGFPVFDPKDLSEVLAQGAVSEVILALPSATRQQRNEILKTLGHHKLAVSTLPSAGELKDNAVSLAVVRNLAVDDLLERDLLKPNGLLLNLNIVRKSVLVTGAGGQVGSELCRQILKANPRQLLMLDFNELALSQIQEELEDNINVEIVPLLASVCDEDRMHEIIDTWRPDTVYHAAGYKYESLVEHNPAEGIRNNVWGTRICAEAAIRFGVQRFVNLSSNSAAEPKNVLAVTKRLAEMVLQSLAEKASVEDSTVGRPANQRTRLCSVRFDDSLNQGGISIAQIREQIQKGGPITLHGADRAHHFRSIQEAAQLLIQAGALAAGGEVFQLDFGPEVRLEEMARKVVSTCGLTVKDDAGSSGDIALEIGVPVVPTVGPQPNSAIKLKPTQQANIMKVESPATPWSQLEHQLDSLSFAVGVNDVPVIQGLLRQIVPNYESNRTVADWVHVAQMRDAPAVDDLDA